MRKLVNACIKLRALLHGNAWRRGGVQVGVAEGTGQHSDVERNRKNNNFAEQERDNRKRGIK